MVGNKHQLILWRKIGDRNMEEGEVTVMVVVALW
jgi:hypothetical protein